MNFLRRLFSWAKGDIQRRYDGYNWAMKELADGNEAYVESWAYDHFHDDEFNAGIRDALHDWNL